MKNDYIFTINNICRNIYRWTIKKLKLISIFTLIMAFAVSCTKDKTMSDYQREKLRENLALYQSVAGNYTGLVRAKNSDQIIGAMQISLSAETVVDSSKGGDSALGTPILVSNIRFLDKNIINLSGANSFYDSSTGSYNTHIVISRSSGSSGSGPSEEIIVSGSLSNGTLQGGIASISYPNHGGEFILLRGGASIQDLKKSIPQSPDSNPDQRNVSSYIGETEFTSGGVSRPVQIVIVQPLRGTPEDFLDLVSPIKSVQINFNYSESLSILFLDSVFDVEQGLITGQTSVVSGGRNKRMNLECHFFEKVNVTCRHITADVGVAAKTVGILNSQNKALPPDDTTDRQLLTKQYAGLGRMGDQNRRITMSVTLPLRDRLTELLDLFFPVTEKLMDVTIRFSEDVMVSFINLKWDALSGLLDGSAVGGDRTSYYQCHDFYFTTTKNTFKCHFWTNRSPTIEIVFAPPF